MFKSNNVKRSYEKIFENENFEYTQIVKKYFRLPTIII